MRSSMTPKILSSRAGKISSKALPKFATQAHPSCLQELSSSLNLQTSGRVLLTESTPDYGRRLIAACDVEPGTVLLSLPISKTFRFTEASKPLGGTRSPQLVEWLTIAKAHCSHLACQGRDEEQNLPWSLAMALDILEQKARGRAGGYNAWLSALPSSISLPITDKFSESELLACQDAETICTAQGIRRMLTDAAKALAGDLEALEASPADLAWALGCVHSRSFVTSEGSRDMITHTVAPGIDMANHSFKPTASVRMQHSPDTCQGREAVEEVCEPPSGGGDSRIELVAMDGGIREGEEVTILYGQYPDDVFYLFYGFLPDSNPFNSVLLYEDTAAVARSLESEGIPSDLRNPQGLDNACSASQRLIATEEGFGQDLLEAVVSRLRLKHSATAWELLPSQQRVLLSRGAELDEQQIMGRALSHLSGRCRDLLAGYPSSIEEDRQLLKESELSPNVQLSIAFRLRKKRTLQHIIHRISELLAKPRAAARGG